MTQDHWKYAAFGVMLFAGFWMLLDTMHPPDPFGEAFAVATLIVFIVSGLTAVHLGAGCFALAYVSFGLYLGCWPPLPHSFDHLIGSDLALYACCVGSAGWLVWASIVGPIMQWLDRVLPE